MPGPSPTPTPILKARGSWRAKERGGEPSPALETPSCPSWLKGESRREWQRQCAQLRRLGILAKCDRAMLAAYCAAWGEFVEAQAWVEENGFTAVSPNGCRILEPMVGVRNRAVERLIKLADRFGFSPAARARVRAEKPAKDEGPQLNAFQIA